MRHSAVTALWVAVLCFAIVQAGRAATQNSIGVQDQAQSATPASASAPTESATPSTTAPPPSAADPSASPAALAPASDANGQGPLVAYVTHSKPPALVDTTVVSAELGMIGAIGAMSQGHDIVVKNNIADPSGEMAHEIATAYAAANGGRVAETPIPDDSFEGSAKLDNLIQAAGGARYVVQVAPPQMDLIYFALDIMHRDILFGSSVRIIDTSNQKVVAKARCFLRTKKTPDLMTHDELLADQAAGLKALIQRKSDACVTKLKSDLKI